MGLRHKDEIIGIGVVDLSACSKKTDIVDNLTSTDTDKPLSANQGKVLKDLIGEGGGVEANPTAEATDTLTKLKVSDTVYDIEGGGTNVLAYTTAEYNALSPKPEAGTNVIITDDDLPNIVSNNDYSLTEQRIGTWIDGKDIYRRVFNITAPSHEAGYRQYFSDIPFDTLVNAGGYCKRNDGDDTHMIGQYYYNLGGGITILLDGSKRLMIYNTSQNLTGGVANVILEYTKS